MGPYRCRISRFAQATACAISCLLATSTGVQAQRVAQAAAEPDSETARVSELPDEAFVVGRRETHVRLVTVKDPTLAMILSVGAPGMGQIYTDRWVRGLAFMGGVAASLVAVGLAADNQRLRLEDYDRADRGGNDDGVVQVAEFQAWEDNPRRDFGDISTARTAVIVGGLAAAGALYIWNVFDARTCAEDHNRRLYSDLTGVQLGLGMSPTGVAQGRLTLVF